VINHVKKNIEKYGSDIWWKWSVMDLLPQKYKGQADQFEKGDLLFDSWFESGCAWYAILCKQIHKRQHLRRTDQEELIQISSSEPEVLEFEDDKIDNEVAEYKGDGVSDFPADMVVEGLNQNEGLLQTICLLSGNLIFNLRVKIYESEYKGFCSIFNIEKSCSGC